MTTPGGADTTDGSRRHPMLAHLVDLEAPYSPEVARDYSVVERLAFALTTGDYCAGLALAWMEEGAAPAGMEQALFDASGDRRLGQATRHRALRLAKSSS